MHFYGRVAAENEKMALFNVLTSLIKRGMTKNFVCLAFTADSNSKSFKKRIKEILHLICSAGRGCGIKRIDNTGISGAENWKDYFAGYFRLRTLLFYFPITLILCCLFSHLGYWYLTTSGKHQTSFLVFAECQPQWGCIFAHHSDTTH